MKITSIIMLLLSAILIVTLFSSKKPTKYSSISELKKVNVNKLDKINEYKSPNNKYTLTTYLYGGVFLKSDHSYIGHLTSNDDKKGRFILWLPPSYNIIRWVDNDNLKVNEETINIKRDTYDFRSK
jgi:Family of unknown function (DUF5412)